MTSRECKKHLNASKFLYRWRDRTGQIDKGERAVQIHQGCSGANRWNRATALPIQRTWNSKYTYTATRKYVRLIWIHEAKSARIYIYISAI